VARRPRPASLGTRFRARAIRRSRRGAGHGARQGSRRMPRRLGSRRWPLGSRPIGRTDREITHLHRYRLARRKRFSRCLCRGSDPLCGRERPVVAVTRFVVPLHSARGPQPRQCADHPCPVAMSAIAFGVIRGAVRLADARVASSSGESDRPRSNRAPDGGRQNDRPGGSARAPTRPCLGHGTRVGAVTRCLVVPN
jgi:hypothetical protein